MINTNAEDNNEGLLWGIGLILYWLMLIVILVFGVNWHQCFWGVVLEVVALGLFGAAFAVLGIFLCGSLIALVLALLFMLFCGTYNYIGGKIYQGTIQFKKSDKICAVISVSSLLILSSLLIFINLTT